MAATPTASSFFIICVFLFACAWMQFFDRLMRIEYLALVPNGQGPMKQNGPYFTDWIKLVYPAEGKFRAADVTLQNLSKDEGADLVGGLRGLDLGESGAMLTGRHHKGDLYVFINAGRAPIDRGCCADTVRIFPKDGSVHRDILIVDAVKKAVNGIPGANFTGISHAFHPWELNGKDVLLLPIIFQDHTLGGATVDGVLALNLNGLTVEPTADGDTMFIPWRKAGTLDTSKAGTVYDIQYKKTGRSVFQQWHGNCVQTYQTSDGTNLLGIATRMDVEAILFINPFLHRASDKGGTIVQRFGSPKIYDSSLDVVGRHNFGVHAADSMPIVPGDGTRAKRANGGLHNLYFYRHLDGRETVTVFVNEVNGHNRSGLFEFDLRLVKDHTTRPDDSVFDTNYTFLTLPFVSMAQGGARPLGEGVYISSSGLADQGYFVADVQGGIVKYDYSYKLLYDPFVFVTWTERPRSRISGVLLTVSVLGALLSGLIYCRATYSSRRTSARSRHMAELFLPL